MINFDAELTSLENQIINDTLIKKCIIERILVTHVMEWAYRVSICLDSNDKYCVALLSNWKSNFSFDLVDAGYDLPSNGIYFIDKCEADKLINKLSSLKAFDDVLNNIDDTTFNSYMNALVAISPLPITFASYIDRNIGYCDKTDIVVSTNNSKIQILQTTIHEIAHALLKHCDIRNEDNKKKQEFEVEFVSLYVLAEYDLFTSCKLDTERETINAISLVSMLSSDYEFIRIKKKEKDDILNNVINTSEMIIKMVNEFLSNPTPIPETPAWSPTGLYRLTPEDNDKLLDIIINYIGSLHGTD